MDINKLYCGDNLEIMDKYIDDNSIDLIYMDPPYFSQKNYGDFDDRFVDIDEYLDFIRPRLEECKRVLSDTGSIYCHLDWHAVHYVKVMMDDIFEMKNFNNEIIWHYGLGAANAKKTYLKKHDTILFYSNTKEYTFNLQRGEVTPQMRAKYCHEDNNGKYMIAKGKKYYLKGGKPLDSVWDIPTISPTSKERLSYPTQKPETLLERIIKASSNPGDVVLDPFCGCGTAVAVAQKLGRLWIGIDESEKAIKLTEERLAKIVGYERLHTWL